MNTHLKAVYFSKKIIKCEECGAKKLCFSNALNQQHKNTFSTFISHTQSYSKGQYLFHSGDKTGTLFILKSGSAKSYLISENGDEQIVGFHFPGEVLGLDDLTKSQHSTSVVFLEDANACMITSNSFKALEEEIPQFQQQIISVLNREIEHVQELLLSTNHLSAEQRIATFILELSKHMSIIGLSNSSFRLSMSRHDIANYLGLAPETTSRLFKKLAADEVINVKNKKLQIRDFQALRKHANSCNECPDLVLVNSFA